MERETAKITAALTPLAVQSLGGRSPRDIMRQLLSRGWQTLVLDGALIDDFSRGVGLFVEEDSAFLLEWYEYVESLLEKSAHFKFDTFLGDGLLIFSTISDSARVNVEFRFCLDLNSANLVTHRVSLTEEEYVWWWRSIAASLLSLANSDHESEF